MAKNILLENWLFRIHRMQVAHYEAAQYFNKLHRYLGVPVIVLSTIVGTSIFVGFLEQEKTLDEAPNIGFILLKIFAGFLSIVSAVLSGLQTFYRFSELSDSHKIAGSKFASLRLDLEKVLEFEKEDSLSMFADDFKKRWDETTKESPSIPGHILNKVIKQFEKSNPDLSKYNMMATT